MANKAKPYIGITGPTSIREVSDVCNEFKTVGFKSSGDNIPMIGFLVSYKTLNGAPTQNRRYPPVSLLSPLLSTVSDGFFTTVHYNSREVKSLSDQVSKLFKEIYEANLCRAIQLNIPWPNLDQVETIKTRFPEIKIIFQASYGMLENTSPRDLALGIRRYGETLSYVLIDPSGGRNIPFDLDRSLAIYCELKTECSELTVGFAGGFNGENTRSRLVELINRTGGSDFSIDAEGGLRDKITNNFGDDILNITKVRGYVSAASTLV